MMVPEIIIEKFKEKNPTMKVIHLREIYSETPGALLDPRTFRNLCREAGIELTKRDENGKKTVRYKLTPNQVKKFKALHGNPYE